MKIRWRPVIFILVLFVIILMVGKVLNHAEEGELFWSGLDYIHKYPYSYDVCFIGPSTAMMNNSNQELYQQYGIAGITIAAYSQPMYIAEYSLEELLNYQSPKAVLLDTASLFYSENLAEAWTQNNGKTLLKNYLHRIKTPAVKWKAFKDIHSYNKTIDIGNCYLEFEYIHENWKNIVNNIGKEDITNHMHGNQILMERIDDYTGQYDESDLKEATSIDENNEKCVARMIERCNEAGVDLILITEKIAFTKEEQDAVAELAEKYGVKYIDVNENIDDIGLQYHRDLQDPIHFNLSGAVKWTDFLGKYLSKYYEIADKRNNPAYERYEEQRNSFDKQKKYMEAATFREYLRTLSKLDLTENIIFISVYDEATKYLLDRDVELLRKLGLKTELMGQFRCSYAAIIDNDAVEEKFALDDVVVLNGENHNLKYRIISGGLTGGGNAGIILNGIDYIQKGRGFNFVIYNRISGQVTDSVYFDTHIQSNPHAEKNTTDLQMQRIEYPAGSFRAYLAKLADLDTREYAIFISVYDDAASGLDSTDQFLLKTIGLETNLKGQYRSSYVAVIHDSEVREKFAPENTVALNGMIGDLQYSVTSGGMSSGGYAGIELDGVDYIQKGRGFNIVVYDLKAKQVEESVYFDTYVSSNPMQGETIVKEFRKDTSEPEEGTFHSYLKALSNLNTEDHAILLSVYDEATTSLTDLEMGLLDELGLKTSLLGQYRCSYAAVIYHSNIEEKFALEDTVTINGNFDGRPYIVMSGGASSGGNASIKINGVEYIQKGRGFNFVIYNTKTGQVEESVYFDTYVNSNPVRQEN